MSQIGNIVVFDGASTPVSHTLIPVSVTRSAGIIEAMWREQLSTVPLQAQVSCSMKMEQLKSRLYKVTQRVNVPVMETVTGQNAAGYTAPPKVAHVDTVEIVGFFSERSTAGGRQLVKQMAANIFNGVSTSVAPVTTGPAAELFTQLIAPT